MTPGPPRWDLTTLFPSPDSPAFHAARADLVAAISALDHRLDSTPPEPEPAAVEEIVSSYDAILATSWHIESYLMALTDADASGARARSATIALSPPLARRDASGRRIATLLSGLDLDSLATESSLLRGLAYLLQKRIASSARTMSPPEEALAALLHASSGASWTHLHTTVTATMTAHLDGDHEPDPVPISTLRGLASDPDRATRRRAWLAASHAWERHALPIAAALNAIKGETLVLTRRRGWPTPLDDALFAQGIDRAVLDAMLAAADTALPILRRFLIAKATLLNLPRLAPYDATAPVFPAPTWTFAAATDVVEASFRAFSPALGALAERARTDGWIDAQPRPGKAGGGLCLWFSGGVSRIRLEFHGAIDNVRTLAHELGHAYHASVLDRSVLPALRLDATPAPLAETASKICEHLVFQELLRRAEADGDPGRIAILDAYLTAAFRSTVGALELFRFEDRLFTIRHTRELSVAELNALMLDIRAATAGDALDPTEPDPWTWAAMPHLYLDGISYYNLPYLFAQLLALGLAAHFEATPTDAPTTFDTLLAHTGTLDPASLTARLGFDLTAPDFWRSGLATIARNVAEFEQFAARHGSRPFA